MNENYQEQPYSINPQFRGRSLASDRLHSLIWAAIIIWAGLVFLADNIGLLNQLAFPGAYAHHLGVWPLIFLGAGLVVLAEVAVRYMRPDLQSEIGGRLTFAAILLGIGLGGVFGWQITWPLLLIAIGASILLGGYFRKSQ